MRAIPTWLRKQPEEDWGNYIFLLILYCFGVYVLGVLIYMFVVLKPSIWLILYAFAITVFCPLFFVLLDLLMLGIKWFADWSDRYIVSASD